MHKKRRILAIFLKNSGMSKTILLYTHPESMAFAFSDDNGRFRAGTASERHHLFSVFMGAF